jgi:hypothetical protein
MTELMVVTKFGKVVMHKAKRNNNLSFSKGKTWHLDDVRALEVIGVSLITWTDDNELMGSLSTSH